MDEIVKQADRILGRQAYRHCEETLKRAQAGEDLDTKALEKCIDTTRKKAEHVQKIHTAATSRPEPLPPARSPSPPVRPEAQLKPASDAAYFIEAADYSWKRFSNPFMMHGPLRVRVLGHILEPWTMRPRDESRSCERLAAWR